MVLKIFARGFAMHKHAYLRDPWNWLDFGAQEDAQRRRRRKPRFLLRPPLVLSRAPSPLPT